MRGAVTRPHVTEIIRDDAIRPGAVARIPRASADPCAREVALANEAQKCVGGGIYEVDGFVCAISEVVPLRGIVIPAHIEGAQIGWGSLD